MWRRHRSTLAPDLPVADADAGLEAYADVVGEAIGNQRDVVVVGQSFGGYVARMVAVRVGARLIVLVAGMVPTPGDSAEEMFANTSWHAPEAGSSTIDVAGAASTGCCTATERLMIRLPSPRCERGPSRPEGPESHP